MALKDLGFFFVVAKLPLASFGTKGNSAITKKGALFGFFFFENGVELGPSSIFGTKPKLDYFKKKVGQFAIALASKLELRFKLKFYRGQIKT